MAVLGMFPLGTVLVPGQMLPLHVFEERFRTLVRHCLEGIPEFGVVLIERGSEVGGGDVRRAAGTVARILEAQTAPDGRSLLAAVGARRIKVDQWLDDDPYPKANVTDWPDEQESVPPGAMDRLAEMLRSVLAAKAEVGDAAAPVTTELADDEVSAIWQAALESGLGPADLYDLLCKPGPASRLSGLMGFLDEQKQVLEYRLGHPPVE